MTSDVLLQDEVELHTTMAKQADPQEHGTEQSDTVVRMATDAHLLPTELSEVARELHISSGDTQLLRQLADEAVSRFAADDEAITWLEDEVRTRYPNLWWSIREWIARRLPIDPR